MRHTAVVISAKPAEGEAHVPDPSPGRTVAEVASTGAEVARDVFSEGTPTGTRPWCWRNVVRGPQRGPDTSVLYRSIERRGAEGAMFLLFRTPPYKVLHLG